MRILRTSTLLALILANMTLPVPGRAAQSYDNCTGFIDSLPASITTQGTWCLRRDLSTAVASGAVITVNTNNVIIDCNDFKLGGLAAGASTSTTGILGLDRLNITVRRCNVRGFLEGIALVGANGGGHVVEDNRLDGNTAIGIDVHGDGSVIRRNLVRATGGGTGTLAIGSATAIWSIYGVDVMDNTIDGVAPTPGEGGNATAMGIYKYGTGGSVSENKIRGLAGSGESNWGIYAPLSAGRSTMRGNDVVGAGAGTGIRCGTAAPSTALGNVINGFTVGMSNCIDGGGNHTQ